MDLTEKQKATLKFVYKYMKKEEKMPFLKDIGREFHLSSKSSCHFRIAVLVRNGYMERKFNSPRGIIFTSKGEKYIKEYV